MDDVTIKRILAIWQRLVNRDRGKKGVWTVIFELLGRNADRTEFTVEEVDAVIRATVPEIMTESDKRHWRSLRRIRIKFLIDGAKDNELIITATPKEPGETTHLTIIRGPSSE